MKPYLALLAAACFLATSSAVTPRAAQPNPRLAPGTTFSVTFPEMPPTYYAIQQKNDVKAQMTVFLPTNYDSARKHPLLLFLNGGSGGTGADLGVARSLCEGKDFVCLSVPLFKRTAPSAPGGHTIMRDEDGRTMWPLLKAMLAKLDSMVPDLDPAHQVLAGFSNGAHAAQGMLDQSGGEVARRFSAFLFVEGGGRLQHYELLKGKPYLILSSQPGSRRRAQQIYDMANAAGAKATFLYHDVGKHDFPVGAYPAVREWLRGPAVQ